MNRNTIRPTATALATIANDGLLGGQPVESNAELSEKYPDYARQMTKLQESVAWAMAKLQDPEYVRTAGLSPAFAEAETTGRIGRHYIAPDIPADRLLSPEEYDALQERIALGLDAEIPENGAVGHRGPKPPYAQPPQKFTYRRAGLARSA